MLLFVILLGVHVLAGVYWAGTTFVLARGAAVPLFRAQMGAATLSMLAGLGLWGIRHRGPLAGMEWTLLAGALAAVLAAGVQGALNRKSPLLGQRIAAGLLLLTVLCMTVAPYIP